MSFRVVSSSNACTTGPISGSRFSNFFNSTMISKRDLLNSLISSSDGLLSSPLLRPFQLKQLTGFPCSKIQSECKRWFLLSAAFSILLRIVRNCFLSPSFSIAYNALSRSFSTKCLTGKSLVRIGPAGRLSSQTFHANISRTACRSENSTVNFPRALSYAAWSGLSSMKLISPTAFGGSHLCTLMVLLSLVNREEVTHPHSHWQGFEPRNTGRSRLNQTRIPLMAYQYLPLNPLRSLLISISCVTWVTACD